MREDVVAFRVRKARQEDLPVLTAMWNDYAAERNSVYRPVTDNFFREFLAARDYRPVLLILEESHAAEGKALCRETDPEEKRNAGHDHSGVTGFVMGTEPLRFLPGETAENTPAYLSFVYVWPECRRQGYGTALLRAFEEEAGKAGKHSAAVHDRNPLALPWTCKRVPHHYHNTIPGVDTESDGYRLLCACGYEAARFECSMYIDLAGWKAPADLPARQEALRKAGIETGHYDPAWNLEYDSFFTHVGVEYWRETFRTEITKERPRKIPAAWTKDRLIGFTGPVDLEPTGRGWFSGICVDPDYSGKGIATVLFNLLLEDFVAEGASFTSLFCEIGGAAQKTYRKAGMIPVRYFAYMRKEI